MKKRILALVLALAAVVSLPGCEALLESEYETASEHTDAASDVIQEASGITAVSTYAELKDTILSLVKSGSTNGKIRFAEYDGDPQTDTASACMEVSCSEPIGAYSVYYISSSVTKVFSTQQAEIYINYKRTPRQISAIVDLESTKAIDLKIKDTVSQRKTDYAFLTKSSDFDLNFAQQSVQDLYYRPWNYLLLTPTISMNVFPENSEKHIVEYLFSYPYSSITMDEMYSDLTLELAHVEAIVSVEGNSAKQLLAAFEDLSNRVTRVSENSAEEMADTAYGAYVNGRATNLGISMAFKSAATYLGYECYTVCGTFKNKTHYWNIVRCGDYYYHCDPFRAEEKGIAASIFRTDAELSREYSWNQSDYPVCDGDLNYYSVSEIYG